MATTPLYGLPSPEYPELADGPVQFLELGQAVEDLLSIGSVNLTAGHIRVGQPLLKDEAARWMDAAPRFASAAARDAALTSPEAGQLAYLTDSGALTIRTASAWRTLALNGVPNVAMNDLTDADTTTTPPGSGWFLIWNGANWVPLDHVGAADPHTQYQKEAEKGVASGYASLDGATKVPLAQLPTGTTASTVALGNAPAAAVTAHEAAADPHAQYQRESEKGVASGYASLDGVGKVPFAQVPTGSTASTVAVGNHDHAGVYPPVARQVVAGNGLTGGGDLTADRTLAVGAGTGISVAADSVALDTAYTDGRYVEAGGDTMTGALTLSGNPTNALHAATKQYVDVTAQGFAVKGACRVVSTSNLAALTGTPTIDGVPLVAGDRVLIVAQTTASQNGVWIAGAAGWTRAADMDASGELTDGTLVPVSAGMANADTLWVCTAVTATPWVPDASGSTWTKFSSLSDLGAGNGLTKTGGVLDVGQGTGITVAADSVAVNTTVIQAKSEKGAASGYASLDASTKVPVAQLPVGTTAGNVAAGDHTHAALAGGLPLLADVACVATSQTTASGTPVIDGYQTVAGDRVLLAGQTTASGNGIFVVAAGAWARAADADAEGDLRPGMTVLVRNGTVGRGKTYACDVAAASLPWTPGTDACALVDVSHLSSLYGGKVSGDVDFANTVLATKVTAPALDLGTTRANRSGGVATTGGDVLLDGDNSVAVRGGGSYDGRTLTLTSVQASLDGPLNMGSNAITGVADGAAGSQDAATVAQLEARTPKIIVLGPSAPVPGGTPVGTIIVRTSV